MAKLMDGDVINDGLRGHHALPVEGNLAGCRTAGPAVPEFPHDNAGSRDPAHPRITEAEIAWGWALAEHCTKTLLRDAGRFLADSEFEKRLNKAINIIGKHGPCSRRNMFHKGLKLAEREFRDVINALVTHGVVIETLPPTTGVGRPPSPRYVLAQSPDDTVAEEGVSDE